MKDKINGIPKSQNKAPNIPKNNSKNISLDFYLLQCLLKAKKAQELRILSLTNNAITICQNKTHCLGCK